MPIRKRALRYTGLNEDKILEFSSNSIDVSSLSVGDRVIESMEYKFNPTSGESEFCGYDYTTMSQLDYISNVKQKILTNG